MKHSKHALKRMQQRSFRAKDLDILMLFGTESDEGYYLRDKDVVEVESEFRAVISALHRLKGKYVVAAEDTFVTCYYPSKSKQKKIMRGRQC
jgi:hypothetical protein